MEKIRKGVDKFLRKILSTPDLETKPNSMYILMPNGPMKQGSIGKLITHELIHAYVKGTEDVVDQEALLSAMHANYEAETLMAWQAFLAEIGYEE